MGATGIVLTSLVIVYLPARHQQAIAHVFRQSILLPFTELHGTLTRMETRARDFDVLRAQLDSAAQLLAAHRTLAEENRQLRQLLALGERPEVRYQPTAVLRSGMAGSESEFRIGSGVRHGVRPFSAVVTERGLLGQVQGVQPTYSLAIDWSHPDFRVSAMTTDGDNHGIVEPERGTSREQDRLVLNGVDFLAELEPGTEVVTSGRGGTFPRGVRIGWVVGVAQTMAGWSRSYYLSPAVYPGAATYASVAILPVSDSVVAVDGPENPP